MGSTLSWMSRRWYLVLLMVIVGLAVLGGGIILTVSSFMKSSDAYTEAMQIARSNPALIEMIGEPIEEGFLPTGEISTSGSSGKANLAISLSGPKGAATLYLESKKSVGKWKFNFLTAVVNETGQEIDLLAETTAKNPKPAPQ